MLITTPINAYVFSTQLDTYEDLFLSYPALKIKNDTLYFRGSSKVLLLLDGVPISSLKDVCLTLIEKVEVVAQDVSSLYGNYDAVVNIITKKATDETPYSKVKLYKNPDHVEFEFGRKLLKDLGLYLAGDLNSTSRWNANLGYTTKFVSFRTYFCNELTSGVAELALRYYYARQVSLLQRFYLKQDFFSITNLWTLKDHKILLGTENIDAFFIQDYWEPFPLLYVVPGLRYDEQFHPKISVGYIPHLNMIVFGSLTLVGNRHACSLVGLRVFESSICLFKNEEYGIETRAVSPWIWDFKLTVASSLPMLSDYQSVRLSDLFTGIIEYRKQFRKGDLGVYMFGDLNNLRLELKIIDIKVFYRLQKTAPSYGLSWEFWD